MKRLSIILMMSYMLIGQLRIHAQTMPSMAMTSDCHEQEDVSVHETGCMQICTDRNVSVSMFSSVQKISLYTYQSYSFSVTVENQYVFPRITTIVTHITSPPSIHTTKLLL